MNQKDKDKLEALFLKYGNSRWDEGASLMEPREFSDKYLSESTKIYGEFLELLRKLK